jgi:hypothetical protein
MCTECAFITARLVFHKSDAFGERTPFGAAEHPGLGQCYRKDTT